jgi:signal transduction histidine kinase
MLTSQIGTERARGGHGAMGWWTPPVVFWVGLFAVAYVAGAGVGQFLKADVSVTYWPPAGIFVGALLMAQRRTWGWYLAAGLAAELCANAVWFHNPLGLACIYYAANAIVALGAATLILRFVSPFRLESIRDVTIFIVLGAIIAPIAGATIIATTDAAVGKYEFWRAFRLVWLGDGAGVLVATPLVYVVVDAWRTKSLVTRDRMIEVAALAVVLVVAGVASFGDYLSTMYYTLPVLLWASARFQLKGAVAALALTAAMLISFAGARIGKFDDPEHLRERIVLAQAFLGISAASSLLVAVLSRRYQDAMGSLRATNSELETRVADRTANLRQREAELRAHQERLEQMIVERTRELEESIRKLSLSERMASLGTLSAGLGHDMANILVPMRMSLANLERAELPPARREDVQVLARSSEYLKNLALGLRLLSLDPEDDTCDSRTQLDQWWPEAATICKAVLPRGVVLHDAKLEGSPRVAIPSHALTQAVFNLIQNAGDAMRDRGRGNVWVRGENGPAGYVLGVRDDGPGMTDEVRARCMEPFFTTKARGRGTGLGLAIVYRVLHRFNGSVEIRTAPGEGTEFRLTLPLAAATAATRVSAIVRIEDARTRAVAHALLAGRGARLVDGTPQNGDAALLIADAVTPDGSIDAFLRGGGRRMVIRIGANGVQGGDDPRVIRVGEVRVTRVREAIAGAIDHLEVSL